MVPPPPGKYVVLFFYPLDFTFVCPTEIIAFSEHAEDFRKLGCEVLGVSVDSQFTHLAWYERGPAGGRGLSLHLCGVQGELCGASPILEIMMTVISIWKLVAM